MHIYKDFYSYKKEIFSNLWKIQLDLDLIANDHSKSLCALQF